MAWMVLTLFTITYEVINNFRASSYYVAIVPIIYWGILTVLSLRDYRKLINEIDGKINNENDLIYVKSFINNNMRYTLFLAIFYIASPVFLFIFDNNMFGLGIFFTYFVGLIPFLPFLKQLERNIEGLEVDNKNTELRNRLAYFIKKWHGPGFRLPDK